MKIASDVLEVRLAIEENKRHGNHFLTNFFLDVTKLDILIKAGLLSYKTIGKSLFFTKKNINFVNLYYFSLDLKNLSADLDNLNKEFKNTIFVIDVVGFFDQVSNISDALIEVGFNKYTSLVRMSKTERSSINEEKFDCVFYSDLSQINDVFIFLNQYFDEYAEQIPNLSELKELALKQRVLLYYESNKIKGFLIFEIKGLTSHLRYWFVLPEYRGRKVGSFLFQKYLYECLQTKRQLFWVIETNQNAIVRYEHYGFKKENLVDQILTNRGINYGTKSI